MRKQMGYRRANSVRNVLPPNRLIPPSAELLTPKRQLWQVLSWRRQDGFSCCRSTLRALYAITAASNALTPSHGNALAWDDTPWNNTRTSCIAKHVGYTQLKGFGWAIKQKSTSSKQPFSIILIFPPPPSSAGVPRTTTLPRSWFDPSSAAFKPKIQSQKDSTNCNW